MLVKMTHGHEINLNKEQELSQKSNAAYPEENCIH